MPEEGVNSATELSAGAYSADALRQLLAWGAAAALVGGGLSAAGTALEGIHGEATGFTLGTALMLLSVLPQVVVLAAFVRLANVLDENRANALRRSSICAFASFWLLTVFGAVSSFFPEPSQDTILNLLIAVGVCCVAILIYAIWNHTFWVLWGTYLSTKYLGGWMVIGRGLPTLIALGITACVLLVGSLVAYPIWFAVSLLRSRDRLGTPALMLGTVVLLSLVVGAAFLGWVVLSVATTPGIAGLDEQAFDDLFAGHLQRFLVFAIVEEMLGALFTAYFFLGVRQRLSSFEHP